MNEPFTVFIPARTESTRLPRKLYEDVGGMSVIERTWRQAMKSMANTVVIVSKDDEMRNFCLNFIAASNTYALSGNDDAIKCLGGVFKTDGKERNGTEACAQAAANLPENHICVNVQGDSPLTDPNAIDGIAHAMSKAKHQMMMCLTVMLEQFEIDMLSICKVVMDDYSNALYFSRAPIPASKAGLPRYGWGHMGMYAYTAAGLRAYALMEPTYLEMVEGLEQNRPLHYGMNIKCFSWNGPRTPSVDTAEDLRNVRQIVASDPDQHRAECVRNWLATRVAPNK